MYVVPPDGSIRIPGRDLLLSPILRGEPLCLEPCEDGKVVVKYGPLSLGTITSHGRFVRGRQAPRASVSAAR